MVKIRKVRIAILRRTVAIVVVVMFCSPCWEATVSDTSSAPAHHVNEALDGV